CAFAKIQIENRSSYSNKTLSCRKYLTAYLDEYCWRRNICESKSEVSICILKEIARHYTQENDLIEKFFKLSTESSQDECLFDVEQVDSEKLDLPLYETDTMDSENTENTIGIKENETLNNRKLTASNLIYWWPMTRTRSKRASDFESDDEYENPKKQTRKPKNQSQKPKNDLDETEKGYLVKLKKNYSSDFKAGKCLMVFVSQIGDDKPENGEKSLDISLTEQAFLKMAHNQEQMLKSFLDCQKEWIKVVKGNSNQNSNQNNSNQFEQKPQSSMFTQEQFNDEVESEMVKEFGLDQYFKKSYQIFYIGKKRRDGST
ncbi:unnamed protein product, partial [Brachionus calyciflorus]